MRKLFRLFICVFFTAVFLTSVFPKQASSARLPDTGQMRSYTTTFGEDSDYIINPPSYTKLDESGSILPDSATLWSMVRDNNTGLIWEIKTSDGSIQDRDNTYNWSDAQDVFITGLNNSGFGGFSDWRLPNPKELLSIVHYDSYHPAINSLYFPNTHESPDPGDWAHHWTSTTAAFNDSRAWHVIFDGGASHDNFKSNDFCARAVRGDEFTSNLVDNGDGTISDTATKLIWEQKTDDGGPNDKDNMYTWEEALAWVATLNNSQYLGYDDWRLPNIKELQSIVDFSQSPAIDFAYFQNTQWKGREAYWSSTSLAVNPNYAWVVGFDYGYVDYSWYTTGKLDTSYVRAVRTIPEPVPEPSTMLLLGLGIAGLAAFRWSSKKEGNR